MGEYVRNLSLYVRGFRWLWSRQNQLGGITYKPGWGPWKFLPVYATTYLLGTLWGVMGISSLSRIWYERSGFISSDGTLTGAHVHNYASHNCDNTGCRPLYPFSRWIIRQLDNWLPGQFHGARTGPANLWGSRNAWE